MRDLGDGVLLLEEKAVKTIKNMSQTKKLGKKYPLNLSDIIILSFNCSKGAFLAFYANKMRIISLIMGTFYLLILLLLDKKEDCSVYEPKVA